MTTSKIWLTLTVGALVSVAFWDVWVHIRPVRAQSRAYPRSKYYTTDPPRPFTLVSLYTVTSEGIEDTVRVEVTEATDSRGRSLHARKQFSSASDAAPTIESAHLVERPDGKLTIFYWSKWQQALGKPMLVAYGTDSKLIHSHTLPENNCTSPEPALTFLRYEPVRIGGRDYPAAVVQSRDEVVTMTAWHSMTPALGCIELKSIANYTSPGLGRGTTVHEPLSLTLTEPDSQLLDLQAKISATAAVEVVPLSSWETTVKSKIKAYEAASAQK